MYIHTTIYTFIYYKQFKLGICIYKYMNKSKPLSYFAKVFTQWTL